MGDLFESIVAVMQNSFGVDTFYRWHVLKKSSSMLVIKFGQCEFLRKGEIIGSLMDA